MRLEPDWWARARRLSAQGVTATRIAKTIGRSKSAVLYCLNPSIREKAIAASSHRWAKHTEAGGTSAGQTYDKGRQKLRRIVRDECRASGHCPPDVLRRAYRQHQCL